MAKKLISDLNGEEITILISKLTEIEKFCLDAYMINDMKDTEKVVYAYRLSRPKDSQAKEQSIYFQARRWITSEPVQAYIHRKQRVLNSKTEVVDEDGNLIDGIIRSKEEKVILLNKFLTKAEKGGNGILANSIIQTLNKIEDEEPQDKESQISYFVPIKCSNCPIKAEHEADRLARNNIL